jgi:ubiquinone/menaquinone biosynthesis C-methylase UbiE
MGTASQSPEKGPLTEWDRILPERTYSPEEPDETVVSFAGSLHRRRKEATLDLACGAGRHVVYLARQGFTVTGADISRTGLKMTRKKLEETRLTAALVRSAMNSLPFSDSSFDTVICTRAIYHQRLRGIQQTLSEIRRVLRKGGLIMIDFLSKRTHSHAKGVEVEAETFIETEGHERGIVHHYTDREELQRLFIEFRIISVDLNETEFEGRLRSRFTVQASRR